MVEIYKSDNILIQNSYFIDQFRKSIDLIVEKRTDNNIFQEILDTLFDYFSEIKEHRTIIDVENAFKKVDDIFDLNNLEGMDEKLIEEESDNLKEDLKEFIANNSEKLILSINDAKIGFMINYWISNLEIATEVLDDFFKEFKRKKRFSAAKSFRVRDFLKRKLDRIYKGFFLVFFRIIEQIYMIADDRNFIPENEIDFLIEDVVYLENIARATHENF